MSKIGATPTGPGGDIGGPQNSHQKRYVSTGHLKLSNQKGLDAGDIRNVQIRNYSEKNQSLQPAVKTSRHIDQFATKNFQEGIYIGSFGGLPIKNLNQKSEFVAQRIQPNSFSPINLAASHELSHSCQQSASITHHVAHSLKLF